MKILPLNINKIITVSDIEQMSSLTLKFEVTADVTCVGVIVVIEVCDTTKQSLHAFMLYYNWKIKTLLLLRCMQSI